MACKMTCLSHIASVTAVEGHKEGHAAGGNTQEGGVGWMGGKEGWRWGRGWLLVVEMIRETRKRRRMGGHGSSGAIL